MEIFYFFNRYTFRFISNFLQPLIQMECTALTLLRRVKRVIFWHVLYVVFQRRFRQYEPLLVDLVHGILEGQLRTAILLVMSEYSTWNRSTINRSETMIPSARLNMIFAIVAENFPIKIHSFRANILGNLLTPLFLSNQGQVLSLYIISKARSSPSLIVILLIQTTIIPKNVISTISSLSTK